MSSEKKISNIKNNIELKPNIFLVLFDIIILPIHIIRLIIIYFFGSKYNLKGFKFLDVIMHSDNPYFNQEDCRLIDTIGKDYRVAIREDSRIFPMDINTYFRTDEKKKVERVVIGSTTDKDVDVWNSDTEDDIKNDIDNDKEDSFKEVNRINSRREIEKKVTIPSDEDDTESDDISDETSDETSDNQSDVQERSEKSERCMVSTIENTEQNKKNSGRGSGGSGAMEKGVNYFESSEEISRNKKKNDILDSIRAELDSAFEQ
jgi:hypothetical protein